MGNKGCRYIAYSNSMWLIKIYRNCLLAKYLIFVNLISEWNEICQWNGITYWIFGISDWSGRANGCSNICS